jgi:hypothetical protein
MLDPHPWIAQKQECLSLTFQYLRAPNGMHTLHLAIFFLNLVIHCPRKYHILGTQSLTRLRLYNHLFISSGQNLNECLLRYRGNKASVWEILEGKREPEYELTFCH